jgi:hypothetical protein
MQQGFITVPFKTESGVSQINGIGKFSSAGIVLEFESKIFGIISGGVKEVRISLDELLDVRFRKGFFKRGAKIEIRLKSFARLSELPSRDGKVILKIKAADYERASEAAAKLQKDLGEHHEGLPPVHTPVNHLFNEEETKELER